MTILGEALSPRVQESIKRRKFRQLLEDAGITAEQGEKDAVDPEFQRQVADHMEDIDKQTVVAHKLREPHAPYWCALCGPFVTEDDLRDEEAQAFVVRIAWSEPNYGSTVGPFPDSELARSWGERAINDGSWTVVPLNTDGWIVH